VSDPPAHPVARRDVQGNQRHRRRAIRITPRNHPTRVRRSPWDVSWGVTPRRPAWRGVCVLLSWLPAVVGAAAVVGCGASARSAGSGAAGRAATGEPSYCSSLNGRAALERGAGSSGAFPTATDGWILFTPAQELQAGGVGGCDSLLRVTHDGGRHFRPVRVPRAAFAAVVAASPTRVWLIGRQSYASDDGGRRWRELGLPAQVQDVVLEGRIALALGPVCGDGSQCDRELLRSTDAGIHWQRQRLPPSASGPLAVRGPLVAITTATHVLISRDGGQTVVQRPSACRRLLSALVAIDPAGTLWELCAGVPGAGYSGKLVFESHDLARHWTRTSPGTLGDTPYPLGEGYIGTLAAPAPGTLLITRARGGLAYTNDGGRHWTDAIPDINDADPAAGWMSFPTRRRGYAWITEDQVFRTVDGGRRWQPIPIRALVP
jgi:hypothetical protein